MPNTSPTISTTARERLKAPPDRPSRTGGPLSGPPSPGHPGGKPRDDRPFPWPEKFAGAFVKIALAFRHARRYQFATVRTPSGLRRLFLCRGRSATCGVSLSKGFSLQKDSCRCGTKRQAPVAQLDRAPDYESGGQEFESSPARHSQPSEISAKIVQAPGFALRSEGQIMPWSCQRTDLFRMAGHGAAGDRRRIDQAPCARATASAPAG